MPYLIGFLGVSVIFAIVILFISVINGLKISEIILHSIWIIPITFVVGVLQYNIGFAVYNKNPVLKSTEPLLVFKLNDSEILAYKTNWIIGNELRGTIFTFFTVNESGVLEKHEGFVSALEPDRSFKIVYIATQTPRLETYELVPTIEGKENLMYFLPLPDPSTTSYEEVEILYVPTKAVAELQVPAN